MPGATGANGATACPATGVGATGAVTLPGAAIAGAAAGAVPGCCLVGAGPKSGRSTPIWLSSASVKRGSPRSIAFC